MISKRVTPSKRSKKSAHSAIKELFGQHDDVERGGLAKVLAEAIDSDPFEIIGFASIAT